MITNAVSLNHTPPVAPSMNATAREALESVARFARWLERAGYDSYDPYDLWGTRYGLFARRLYYARNPLGVALTAPVILLEMVCPWLRGILVGKARYATADAQLALAYLNLRQLEEDYQTLVNGITDRPVSWLARAEELAEDILGYSITSGYSGHGWGYPFDWQNVNGLMPKRTPHITATPYCFELLLRLFDITGKERYLDVAKSVAAFVFNDLKDTPAGENAAAASYAPGDEGKVVNASAYRAFVLFESARRFGVQKYADAAWKNLRFILQSQRADGSWLYALDSPGEAFIDHFHTCFVLKNLYKINVHLEEADVARSIQKGFAYYRRDLFGANDLPKSFAIEPRMQLATLEMYNVAEAINLGALLRAEIPAAFDLGCSLATRAHREFQTPAGYFVTRVYRGGIRHTTPFLRWPQAQMFHAMTHLLSASLGSAKRASVRRVPQDLTPATT